MFAMFQLAGVLMAVLPRWSWLVAVPGWLVGRCRMGRCRLGASKGSRSSIKERPFEGEASVRPWAPELLVEPPAALEQAKAGIVGNDHDDCLNSEGLEVAASATSLRAALICSVLERAGAASRAAPLIFARPIRAPGWCRARLVRCPIWLSLLVLVW